MIYLLKTKGTATIPDYLQVRDENFLLIAHFGMNQLAESIKKHNLKIPADDPEKFILNMPYGKLTKIDNF